MKPLCFSLKPFRADDDGPRIEITGTIGRHAGALSVLFALQGDLSGLSIPPPAASPQRKDRLWEGTCLELFLGPTGSEGYWEFNLSPAGHWNAYRFTSYRKEMREEPAFASLPFVVRTAPGALALSLNVDIGAIVPTDKTVEVGAAAVIATVAGGTIYWALAHPGPRPDFHRRDGFTLMVPDSP